MEATQVKTPWVDNKLVIVLVGKTGHGKSATGNTILGRPAFQVADSSQSYTNVVQSSVATRGDHTLHVVDSPGVFETRVDRGKAATRMVSDMSQCLQLCKDGIDVLVLVLKYGNRFTEEERRTVETLKSVFGLNFLRQFGMMVFTHGEDFDLNHNGDGQRSFGDWLNKQSGSLKSVIDECDKRCVLFRNRAGDGTEVQRLLDMVKGLKNGGSRYTKSMFDSVAREQEQYIARENAAFYQIQFQGRFDQLQISLYSVLLLTENSSDIGKILEEFGLLVQDILGLKQEIVRQDKGTDVLKPLKQCVEGLEQTVNLRQVMFAERQVNADLRQQIGELAGQLGRYGRELEEMKQKVCYCHYS